jgi:hypothetical protein
MIQRLRNLFIDFWVVLAFGLAASLLAPTAHAGLIGTDAAAAQDERMRVKAMLERPELTKGLAKLGLTPTEAAARVDALGDGEVLQLAGKLDAAIAAGQISNETLLLIIILVLVLVILL